MMDNTMDNDNKAVEEKKKKPGRPRKNPLKTPLHRNGISPTPLNDLNCVEMVYDIPSTFRKVFNLFKAMAAKEICIMFDKKMISISAADHLKKSRILAQIDCANVNHYYCKETIRSYLNSKNFEKIIQVLDKNYVSIALVLKTATSRSTLGVIYKNDIKIDEYREIDLVHHSPEPEEVSFDDDGYPIKFTLPSKYFKKLINDIGSFSDVMTISKIGASPLTFTCISTDRTIKSHHIVQSSETINLVSTVGVDDIFSSSIHVDYVKPLSNGLMSDNISISADTHKNMIFKLFVDDRTVQIMVNTSIIKDSG